MATVELTVDTSKLEGFAEFLKASDALDVLYGEAIEPTPGALGAAIERWRKAMRGIKGDVVVLAGAREVACLHVAVAQTHPVLTADEIKRQGSTPEARDAVRPEGNGRYA